MRENIGLWSFKHPPLGLEAGGAKKKKNFVHSRSLDVVILDLSISTTWTPQHAALSPSSVSSGTRAAGFLGTEYICTYFRFAKHKTKVHLFFEEDKRDMVGSVPWRIHHLQGGSIRTKQLPILQVLVLESFSARTPLQVEQQTKGEDSPRQPRPPQVAEIVCEPGFGLTLACGNNFQRILHHVHKKCLQLACAASIL